MMGQSITHVQDELASGLDLQHPAADGLVVSLLDVSKLVVVVADIIRGSLKTHEDIVGCITC